MDRQNRIVFITQRHFNFFYFLFSNLNGENVEMDRKVHHNILKFVKRKTLTVDTFLARIEVISDIIY